MPSTLAQQASGGHSRKSGQMLDWEYTMGSNWMPRGAVERGCRAGAELSVGKQGAVGSGDGCLYAR
jgi:hypothetical protein